MTAELVFLSPVEAQEASGFVRRMWIDTYADIIYGGRERAEAIFEDWVGEAKIRRDMAAGRFFAYIVDEGARVGLASAGAEGGDLVVSKIYILPGRRGMGYGGFALRYMLDYGRRNGCTRAVLEANPGNVHAVEFYRRYGFKVVGTHDYEYGRVYVMAADLFPVRLFSWELPVGYFYLEDLRPLMLLFLVCSALLVLGYVVYSRIAERPFLPFRASVPAFEKEDGVDYVPLPTWKNNLIQLLNIAGTGPIFGALMGAKWGPIVFIWIIGGTILGGAVHDYMSGMISMRNGGESGTQMVKRYIGGWTRYPMLIIIVFLMVMVQATFARSASDLLQQLTGTPTLLWMFIILAYFVASTVLPINKVIGKIYPVFGVLLIAMAVIVIGGLVIGGYQFPSFTLDNLHPSGAGYFPDMFITVACGAISGFHATQSPMVARCLKNEKDGRKVFYGAMVIESFIALIWATAGLAFYGTTSQLAAALQDGGAAGTVYDISTGVAGTVGGAIAAIGVVVCPITSGDTALRAARLMIQDDRGRDTRRISSTLGISIILLLFITVLCMLDFSILWNYFSWINQSLSCIFLWSATVYLVIVPGKKWYSLMTALPGLFMTMVVTSYIFGSSLGFHLDHTLQMIGGGICTTIVALLYLRLMFLKADSRAPAEPVQ